MDKASVFWRAGGICGIAADVRFVSCNIGDKYSFSVSLADDINMDGFSGVIVGSPTGNSSNNYSSFFYQYKKRSIRNYCRI